MSKKYHITKISKEIMPCYAIKNKCPLGDADLHFTNREEAQVYLDNQFEEEHGLLPEIKDKEKDPKVEYPVLVKKEGDGYRVSAPDIPASEHGKTLEDAMYKLKQEIGYKVYQLEDDGFDVPKPYSQFKNDEKEYTVDNLNIRFQQFYEYINDRHNHLINKTKEISNKLNLNANKTYSAEETNQLLKDKGVNKGKFIVTANSSCKGQEIIDRLVELEMTISDNFHKEYGYYGGKTKCESCGDYFKDETIFEIDGVLVCEHCRQEKELKISYYDFKSRVPDDEKEQFVQQNSKFGVDYTQYIERFNNHKNKQIKEEF